MQAGPGPFEFAAIVGYPYLMTDEADALTRRLRAPLAHRVGEELVANSILIPAAVALFLGFCRGEMGWWLALTFPLLALAGVAQAVAVVRARAGRPLLLLVANLLVPGVLLVLWSTYLDRWLPGAALALLVGAGVLVGAAQALRAQATFAGKDLLLVLKEMVRTPALVGLFLFVDGAVSPSPAELFADPRNGFLLSTALALGAVLGLGRAAAAQHLDELRRMAERLAEVSQWSLGATNLQKAMTDERSLAPVRRERAVLFADVRGFTAWSESRSPEEVLGLLTQLYVAAERTWLAHRPLKRKFTGDEVLLVFADPVVAARVALDMRAASAAVLGPQGLGLGIGLHFGPLIEGLIGSKGVRSFDVLGDTVNTGKRVSDHAQSGEILCSFHFYEAAPGRLLVGDARSAKAKGKSNPVLLANLLGVRDAPTAPADPVPEATAPAADGDGSWSAGLPVR
jgi:class 3 adenylate cyclase